MKRIQIGPGAAILGRYANRHGLIAGATGTGKTVTLQTMCEGFSKVGVPVFVADVKGDIAGLAIDGPGEAAPVKFWDVYGQNGAPFRLTVQSLGPDLLARMLELTDAQKGVIEAAFAAMPGMQTLDDLVRAIKRESANYGAATLTAVGRALDRFARQGGDNLIGGPSFDLVTLFDGNNGDPGTITVLDAQRLIVSPVIYSTLMIWMLDELFARMPEVGDCELPRLVIFIDEAHLLFKDAPPALVQKIERTVRLIRSKGVGVYFVTQTPDDLPAPVLGQLGNRVQHALRGATPRDQRAIKAAAETMPTNPAIDAAAEIGRLDTGEALVSFIGPNGAPQPVSKIRVRLPACRLGAITDAERARHIPRIEGATPPPGEVVADIHIPVDDIKYAAAILAWAVVLWAVFS